MADYLEAKDNAPAEWPSVEDFNVMKDYYKAKDREAE